ncbi:MAG: ribonuclease HII [Bryobacteraceae bacterium]
MAKPSQSPESAPVAGTRRSNGEECASKSVSRSRLPQTRCVGTYEREARERGFQCVAGVDEVGRGSLFGPVFAAAVILDPEKPIRGLHDSKILEAEDRNRLAAEIKRKCVACAIGAADAYEIDQINILQASRLAMRRAVERLQPKADYLLIDAITIDLPVEQLPLIDGDARCRAIAAASILAKVQRDACLDQWHETFPQYNLKSNKGYSTPDHRRALAEHGPTSLHRFSFEPVRLASRIVLWTGYVNSPAQLDLFAIDEVAPDEATVLVAAALGGKA